MDSNQRYLSPYCLPRSPAVLATHRDRRCHASEAEIAAALTGNWREEHVFALGQALELYAGLAGPAHVTRDLSSAGPSWKLSAFHDARCDH
jgi:hypothetical protein